MIPAGVLLGLVLALSGQGSRVASPPYTPPAVVYVEPKRHISLNRLLLGAAAQGALFVVVRKPELALFGDGEVAVQVFAPFGLAAVVLCAATPRLNLFYGAIIVAASCFAYVVAYTLGFNVYGQVPKAVAWGLASFVGASILAFVVQGLFFERADVPMTLLVGVVPVTSVILLPMFDIGRVWWAIYHCVWCWLFVAGLAIASKFRGRLEIRGWTDATP